MVIFAERDILSLEPIQNLFAPIIFAERQVLILVTVTAGSLHRQLPTLLSGQGLSVLLGDMLPFLRCENAAFVARLPEELPAAFQCERFVAVIDSASSLLREAVSSRRIPAVTCGLAGTDTFTYSSWRAESAVICLRRTLRAFDGAVIEPFELPVTFSKRPEPFSLLAAASVLCMTGRANPLAEYKVWNL